MKKTNKKVALYPGSFDPITNGHLDIIKRALRLFDRVYVGVGLNSAKPGLFPVTTRVDLIKQACREAKIGNQHSLEVGSFEGLVTTCATQIEAIAIIRGLRTITDFEYEFQFAHVTRKLCPEIEIVLLPTTEENSYVSSSLVKELYKHYGAIDSFVPSCVLSEFAQLKG